MPMHHHHHENKRDKRNERLMRDARKAKTVAVADMPVPLIDIGINKIDELIKSVIDSRFQDSIQEAWVRILGDHVANEQDVLRIASEVSREDANRAITERHKLHSLQEPIGVKNDGEAFTLEDVLPSPDERSYDEIEEAITAEEKNKPAYRSFGKKRHGRTISLQQDTLDAIAKSYPHDSLNTAIKKLALVPIDGKQPYALWEDAVIRRMYPWGGTLAVRIYLNRSSKSITTRAHVLRLRRAIRTANDQDTIKQIIQFRAEREAEQQRRQERLKFREAEQQRRQERLKFREAEQQRRQERLKFREAEQQRRQERLKLREAEQQRRQERLKLREARFQRKQELICQQALPFIHLGICDYCGDTDMLDGYNICGRCAATFAVEGVGQTTIIHCSCPVCGKPMGGYTLPELRRNLYRYCSYACRKLAPDLSPIPKIDVSPSQMLQQVYYAIYNPKNCDKRRALKAGAVVNKTLQQCLAEAQKYAGQQAVQEEVSGILGQAISNRV